MKAPRTDIVVKELCERSGYDKRVVMQVYNHVLNYFTDKIKAGKSIRFESLGEIRLKYFPAKTVFHPLVENEDKTFVRQARFSTIFKPTKPIKEELKRVAKEIKEREPIEY